MAGAYLVFDYKFEKWLVTRTLAMALLFLQIWLEVDGKEATDSL